MGHRRRADHGDPEAAKINTLIIFGGKAFMKHFNLPVSFNYKIFRTMGLFIALFLLSILIRIPATSEIDITRFYSIIIPSILSFLIISYFEKLTCNFFINYFFLLALYLSIPYLKLLDHYVLLPSEIISAFGAGTLLFSVVTYFYLLYSLTPPTLKISLSFCIFFFWYSPYPFLCLFWDTII